MINTLKFVHTATERGCSREQAEALAMAFDDAVRDDLATKQDLQELKSDLRKEIADRSGELYKWLAIAFIAQAGVIVGLVKLLPGPS